MGGWKGGFASESTGSLSLSFSRLSLCVSPLYARVSEWKDPAAIYTVSKDIMRRARTRVCVYTNQLGSERWDDDWNEIKDAHALALSWESERCAI